MKTITKTLISLLLLLALPMLGQTMLTMTTLSSAVTSTSGRKIVVASATGITAGSTQIFVDREAMFVNAVNSTTLTVQRGASGTAAATHASSAVVFIVPSGASGILLPVDPQGSCTRANELYLPRINSRTGVISDCLGGQWVNGAQTQSTLLQATALRFPDPGGTAYASLETAGTAAGAATEIYCTEVDLPYNMLLTGIKVLNGTTVGTNKHFGILYDAGGKVLANSATAGITTAGASTYQALAFTTKYYAVGPARYFACDGLNGTTDTIRHAITGTNDNIVGGAVTGQTFGTAAAVTVPSTFTTAKAPYFQVY